MTCRCGWAGALRPAFRAARSTRHAGSARRRIQVRFLHIEVVTASDGLGALASVADVQPDLMLLDILPPHMDGYQVCDAIRLHQDKHDLAILLLSGKDSVVDRLRGLLAGSTDYISKPFDPAELVWPMKRYLYTPAVLLCTARCAQHVRPTPRRWRQR
jgi:PleD family two-component response regulator